MAEQDFSTIDNDRFLRRDANQTDQTKDAVYVASNPAPKRGDDSLRKQGRPKGSEEDGGAPNVLTGTVITSCFIQTSALPSRVEMQGNDITFFDDTYSRGGKLIGDTSRLIFTHASGKEGEEIVSGFILQKRALIGVTYDNVLELFSPDNSPNTNYIFIGRTGTGAERNTSLIELTVNHDSQVSNNRGFINGILRFRATRDDEDPDSDWSGVTVADVGTIGAGLSGNVSYVAGDGNDGGVILAHLTSKGQRPSQAPYQIRILNDGIYAIGLPTSNPGGTGRIWNDAGTLKIT